VRASEEACPFCAATLPVELRSAPSRQAPKKRLSRAALYAFGATSIGLVTACSGSVTGVGEEDASGDVSRAQPAYGASDPADTGVAGDAEPDQGFAPPYGHVALDAEPPFDAGEPDGIGVPAYGIAVDAEAPLDADFPLEATAAYGGPGVH
jgi:hypothetical protein